MWMSNCMSDMVIIQKTFNSSFSWKYQTWCKYEIGTSEFAFNYRINDHGHERSHGNIIDNNDTILYELLLQPNLKYYDNHDFLKLTWN